MYGNLKTILQTELDEIRAAGLYKGERVIDTDDHIRPETSLEALGREVREETGLEVTSWSDLVYGVSVDFPDREMRLGVEVFRAERWSGDLTFEDPDGIVEDGVFVDGEEGSVLLESAPRWVWEPVGDWLAGRVPDGARYDFLVRGTSPGNLDVERR